MFENLMTTILTNETQARFRLYLETWLWCSSRTAGFAGCSSPQEFRYMPLAIVGMIVKVVMILRVPIIMNMNAQIPCIQVVVVCWWWVYIDADDSNIM